MSDHMIREQIEKIAKEKNLKWRVRNPHTGAFEPKTVDFLIGLVDFDGYVTPWIVEFYRTSKTKPFPVTQYNFIGNVEYLVYI